MFGSVTLKKVCQTDAPSVREASSSSSPISSSTGTTSRIVNGMQMKIVTSTIEGSAKITWIPRAAKEFDGWIASGAKTSLNTLAEGIARYRAAGGTRAIVTNIAVDLTAPSAALDADAPFDLRCPPAAASERLQRLRDLGFDDAVLLIRAATEENLAAARALLR